MSATATITVRLDDGPHSVAAGSSLADLLAGLGHRPDAVATAIDGRFVPREQRASERLQDGQTVLLFQAIVGG